MRQVIEELLREDLDERAAQTYERLLLTQDVENRARVALKAAQDALLAAALIMTLAEMIQPAQWPAGSGTQARGTRPEGV